MIKFLPWHLDAWLSRHGEILPFDKLEHFLLALIGIFVFRYLFKWSLRTSVVVALILSVGWEIKDGVLPWDFERGLIQGFSWKDLIADTAGILLRPLLLFSANKPRRSITVYYISL